MNESFCCGHSCHCADFRSAAALSHDGDIARIATEVGDVVMNPLQSCDEVEHADVAGIFVFLTANAGKIGVSDRTETMVDRYEHDITGFAQVLSVIAVLFDAVAIGVAAAMHPN